MPDFQTLSDATIPGLPNHYRGKVRDNYDLTDGRRIIIASDRLSAFDRNLCSVPFKGELLTQTARYWFDHTGHIVPNHVIAYPDSNVLVCKRLDMLPVELVVRGYLAGTTSTSILTLYKAGQRTMYGMALPDGMRPNQKLPQAVITPTSKAEHGAHDAPMSAAEVLEQKLVTPFQWEQLSAYALALFAHGQARAAERGLILADTKYEFGVDETGAIVLADEIHTPDSSRFWRAATYDARFEAGQTPESFDKDNVRAWVAERVDPYKDDVPEIPMEVIMKTSDAYVEAYQLITGESFERRVSDEPILERIRRNLDGYLAG